MANIKSAAKRALQSEKRRLVNIRRKSAIKTAIKKVETALTSGAEKTETEALLRDVQAQYARAKGKNTVHANTAARKVGRLAKRVAAAHRV